MRHLIVVILLAGAVFMGSGPANAAMQTITPREAGATSGETLKTGAQKINANFSEHEGEINALSASKADKDKTIRDWSDHPDDGTTIAAGTPIWYGGKLYNTTQAFNKVSTSAPPDVLTVYFEVVNGSGGGIAHATSDGNYYASKDGAWASLAGAFSAPLGTDDNYVTDAEKIKLGNLSGTNTGDQDLSVYALTSSVLSKTNTTAFTPSADYHPSTKKYVDDSITASGGYTDEQAQDAVGTMFSGNTETGITVTYDDATGKANFVVATQSDVNFTSAKDTKLTNTPTIASGTVNGQVLTWLTDQWVAGTAPWLTVASLGTDVQAALGHAPNTAGGFLLYSTYASNPLIFWDTNTITETENSPIAGTNTIGVKSGVYQAYDADWLGITSNGAALVSAANYAAMRALLDLEVGTDFNAYSANLTAWAGISPSTGSINTTGAVQAKIPINSYSAAQTLTQSAHNSTIVQMTVAAEVTMWDCEAVNVGDTVMLWARDPEKIEVVPSTGDHFALFNGTALTADYELDVAATAGTKVTLMCTADDTWSVYSETSASVDGGAAD